MVQEAEAAHGVQPYLPLENLAGLHLVAATHDCPVSPGQAGLQHDVFGADGYHGAVSLLHWASVNKAQATSVPIRSAASISNPNALAHEQLCQLRFIGVASSQVSKRTHHVAFSIF
jgi:hypothetical protein